MPRQRGAPAGGQELEAVVEQDGDFLRPQHDRTRRRELDGKRDAVETTADRGDGGEIVLVRGEVGAERPRARHEQLHRGVSRPRRPVRSRPRAARPAAGRDRHIRRRCAAPRGWWPEPWCRDSGSRWSRRASPPRRSHARNCRAPAAAFSRPTARVTDSGEVSSPSSLRPSTLATADGTSCGSCSEANSTSSAIAGEIQTARNLQRQRRLADAAGSGQRDDAIGSEQIAQILHGAAAADQAVGGGWNVGGRGRRRDRAAAGEALSAWAHRAPPGRVSSFRAADSRGRTASSACRGRRRAPCGWRRCEPAARSLRRSRRARPDPSDRSC